MTRDFADIMANRAVLCLVLVLLGTIPVVEAGDDGDWRSREVDVQSWEDGPELEESPMDIPQAGDAVFVINVSYVPGHGQARVEGSIIIELFEKWAPNTTANMIEHIEQDLYDGIFFHRVIDDFVTQSGDPTCRTVGVYPGTNPGCGNGGTGETIDLELHPNLTHVDGAIGMARGMDIDSADSQWYIAETEAHNLDPENREDGGYATFGVVRDGMAHVRAIALTPTSDDPTGFANVQNPASSAGRPIYEAQITEISMLGVIPKMNETQENNDTVEVMSAEVMPTWVFLSAGTLLITLIGVASLLYARKVSEEEIE